MQCLRTVAERRRETFNPLLFHFNYSLKSKEHRFRFSDLWLNYRDVWRVVDKAWKSYKVKAKALLSLN